MGQPFIGEIRMFGGNFAPAGWAFCDGQLLPISENENLFNLIGTTYGGDGQSTFALPNLQSRVPIHTGQGPQISQTYQLAESGGAESVTITAQQLPIHSHPPIVSSGAGSVSDPGGNHLAGSPNVRVYRPANVNVTMAANAAAPAGGSQQHDNMQPYLCVNFIISLFGIYPSPT